MITNELFVMFDVVNIAPYEAPFDRIYVDPPPVTSVCTVYSTNTGKIEFVIFVNVPADTLIPKLLIVCVVSC